MSEDRYTPGEAKVRLHFLDSLAWDATLTHLVNYYPNADVDVTFDNDIICDRRTYDEISGYLLGHEHKYTAFKVPSVDPLGAGPLDQDKLQTPWDQRGELLAPYGTDIEALRKKRRQLAEQLVEMD
jgi:hypothetical protein